MADWTDGPEYAPHRRPAEFMPPDAAPLGPAPAEPEPEPRQALPAGSGPASFTEPDAPALARLAQPARPERDPRTAFAVVTSPLTVSTSGEAVDGSPRDPRAPLVAVQPSVLAEPPAVGSDAAAWPPQTAPAGPPTPAPDAASWPAPAPDTLYPAPVAPRPAGAVALAEVLRAMTPGLVIALGVAALVNVLSLPLVAVAASLSTRIRYRRRTIARTFGVVIGATALLTTVHQMRDYGAFYASTWLDYAGGWFQFAAVLLLVVIGLVVRDALRSGEPPEDL